MAREVMIRIKIFLMSESLLPYLNVDVVIKKKFVFTIHFDMKKHKKEETINP